MRDLSRCNARFWPLTIVVALLSGSFGCGGSSASSAARASRTDASTCGAAQVSLVEVQQVVGKRCVSCHSASGPASDYDWTRERSLIAERRNIGARVAQDSMPPPGLPRLPFEERRKLSCWGL